MKTITKLLVLLLAVVMLVPCLAACGGNGDGNDTTVNNGGPNNPGGEETTTADGSVAMPPVVQLTDGNGGQYVYKVHKASSKAEGFAGNATTDGNTGFYCEDFYVAETSEDALSFAVYTRNQTIQETYNVRIAMVPQVGNMYKELNQFYTNGEKHDATIIKTMSAGSAATGNLLKDINSMQHVDLTHKAFDQNSVKQFSMGGKLYYLSGDMNISSMDNFAPTIVNMQMYNDRAEAIVETFGDEIYSNIYELVTEKMWTMDTMLTIAELANVDVNKSDGALSVTKGDTVGYFMYSASPLYYFYGAGGRISELDEDGYPELVIAEDENVEIYEYLIRNFNTVKNSWIPQGASTDRKTNFYGGGTLFTDMTLWDVRKGLYSTATFEYGILPNPLYEEGNDYACAIYFQNCHHLWAIPSMCTDEANAGRLLQVFAVYSSLKDSTMDAYYTKTMYLTVAGDKGSREVMDIIRASLSYDIAGLYDWGTFMSTIKAAGGAASNQLTSKINNMDVAEEAMQLTLEKFKNPQYVPEE